MARRIFKLTLAASFALALALGASAAHAGRYHVYSCRTPAGEVAPTDGWSGSVAAGGAFDDYALNTCPEGGALVAALGDQTIHGAEIDKATWAFVSPTDTSISDATLWRAGYVHGQSAETATYQLWMNGASEKIAFDECIFTLGCQQLGTFSAVFASQNRVTVPASLLGSRLSVNANCGVIPGHICEPNTGDPNGFAAASFVFAADLTLEDNEGPHASNPGGDLANAPTIQGQSDLVFDATDSGSGVYEALFSVDGQVVQRTVLNSNGGRCKDVGQTTDGLAAFEYVQPCPPSVSVDVPFDTTKVANGEHHLIVSVIDAAGNATPVLDTGVTIANPLAPGTPNGTNATTQANLSVRWMGSKKATRTIGFGRTETLRGRLLGSSGVPIGGAGLDLRITQSYAGATPRQFTKVKTDANGRFELRIRAGASRSLLFAYRAHVGDTLPVATRALTLKVRPGISLSVSPHTTSVGHRIRFAGQLSGGPIPRGGKQLVLEARSPGSPWIEFKVVRTDSHGRYRASYRFKFAGPANYRFRARSEPESDFPFVGGSSNVVAVHER